MTEESTFEAQSDEEKQVSLVNDIIENKIGFGFFQKRALSILGLIDMNDGCEYIIISIVLPIIREEWNNKSIEENPNHQHEDNINVSTFKWLTTIVFIGMFIGSLLTGYFSDKYGRRTIIMACSLLYSIACLYSLFISELYEIFIQRFLQGLIFAVTIPLSTTLFSEIAPLRYRGMGVMFINLGITIGLLFGIILSWAVLDDINHGNWRLLTALQSIQGLIVFICAKHYLLESPRYLMLSNQVNEGILVMNKMISINKGIPNQEETNLLGTTSNDINQPLSQKDNENIFISQEQKQQLILLSQRVQHDTGNNLSVQVFLQKISSLFNKDNIRLTMFLGLQWFFTGFIAFGQIIAVPLVYQEQQKKSFLSLFLSFGGEIPSYFVFYYIFNRPGATRQKSLIICSLISGSFNILFYFKIGMSFSLFMARMTQRCTYILQYLYSNEAYSTHLRATGVGLQNTMTRLGVVIMPFIVLEIVVYSPISVFLLFGIIAYFCAIFAFMLPFDTSSMRLDEQSKILKKNQIPIQDVELNQI